MSKIVEDLQNELIASNSTELSRQGADLDEAQAYPTQAALEHAANWRFPEVSVAGECLLLRNGDIEVIIAFDSDYREDAAEGDDLYGDDGHITLQIIKPGFAPDTKHWMPVDIDMYATTIDAGNKSKVDLLRELSVLIALNTHRPITKAELAEYFTARNEHAATTATINALESVIDDLPEPVKAKTWERIEALEAALSSPEQQRAQEILSAHRAEIGILEGRLTHPHAGKDKRQSWPR